MQEIKDEEVINYKEIFYLDLEDEKMIKTEEIQSKRSEEEVYKLNFLSPIVQQSSPVKNQDMSPIETKLKILKSKRNSREKHSHQEIDLKTDNNYKQDLIETRSKLLHNPKFKDLIKMVEPEIVNKITIDTHFESNNRGRENLKEFSNLNSRDLFFRSLSPTQTKLLFLSDEIRTLQNTIQSQSTIPVSPDGNKKLLCQFKGSSKKINSNNAHVNVNVIEEKPGFKEIYNKEKIKLIKNSLERKNDYTYSSSNKKTTTPYTQKNENFSHKKENLLKSLNSPKSKINSKFIEKEKTKPSTYTRFLSPKLRKESPLRNLLSPIMRDEFKRDFMENKKMELLSLISVANSNSLRDSKSIQMAVDCSETKNCNFSQEKFREETERGLLSGRTTGRTVEKTTCRSIDKYHQTSEKYYLSPNCENRIKYPITNVKKTNPLESHYYLDKLNSLNKKLFNESLNYLNVDSETLKKSEHNFKFDVRNTKNSKIKNDKTERLEKCERLQTKQTKIVADKNTYSVPKLNLIRSSRKNVK
jgi:hypothetical protein